jgi:hypothetical protein
VRIIASRTGISQIRIYSRVLSGRCTTAFHLDIREVGTEVDAVTRDELIWRAILGLTALGVMFLAGYRVGKHVADRWWENFIVTASPFAPPKLIPVTRFALVGGISYDCFFDNAGRAGDIVMWDGDVVGKDGKPNRTCHAIRERIFGLLEKDTPAAKIGSVQLLEDTQRRVPIP